MHSVLRRRGWLLAVVAAGAFGSSAWAVAAEGPNPAPQVLPSTTVDPGATIQVRSLSGECLSANRPNFVSIEMYDLNRPVSDPTVASVDNGGNWLVDSMQLSPDLSPKTYQLRAKCFTSGPNTPGPYYSYSDVIIAIREKHPGIPQVSTGTVLRGGSVEVSSGRSPCPPPSGSNSPAVRASLMDPDNVIRSETQGSIDSFGNWKVTLSVSIATGNSFSVVVTCSASTAASAPYSRYSPVGIKVTDPVTTTTSTTTTTPIVIVADPGQPPPTTTTTAAPPPTPTTMPESPIAAPVSAEPSYTG